MPVRVVDNSVPSQVSGADPGHTSPPACTLLSVGQTFSGTQNVSSLQKDEAWRVNVRIQGCDLDHGYLCGTMEALNVPMADTPVVTFWEGEIVDTKNHTFFTGKWEATSEDDIRHWTKFPSFSPLLSQVDVDGGRSLDLSNYPYIFMRWKEQYFVNVGTDCGLTIAGFYYVCFSCSDGSINGFYYDPNSSPFQKLELKSTNEGRSELAMESLLCDEVWLMSPPDHKHADHKQQNAGNYDFGNSYFKTKEDYEQAFNICLQKEHSYMPEPRFLDHLKSYNLIMPRFIAVQWLIKSSRRLNLSFGTVFNAANYLDRFISMNQCQGWECWMFELLSVACLSVASKFDETNPPSLHEIQMEDPDHSFESSLIQRMEMTVLKALGWRLNSTTAYSYVELLTLNIHEHSLKPCLLEESTNQLAEFLLTTLLDFKFLEFRPCVVAISALQCIFEELHPSTSGTHLAYIFKLIPQDQKDDLIKCREIMEERLVDRPLYNVIACGSSYYCPSSPVTVLTMEQVDIFDCQIDLSLFKMPGSHIDLKSSKKKRKRETSTKTSRKRVSFRVQAANLPAGVELPKVEPKFQPPFLGFTKTAEIWNSRACMIGLIGTFIVELIINKGILQVIGVDIGKGLDLPL
ncbi:hypothetical protein F0562_016296 [Nyssa sinensis]|uniref:Cyclin-like domain-containing protein n=1 Tax=Nyssa sinensis TaxID=561372 RepID=A0A5J4ZJS7_9ASTE|nr:hypothetical protein F0562_016296 [Nyssa sinensis]